jgi:hypothetical protein
MKNAGHDESIKKGTFLLVCRGETYSAEIVKGQDIFTKIFTAMFGPDSKDWPEEECQQWRDEIEDPDYWINDQDYGPTHWESEVGETDHIELFLITDPTVANG